MENLQDQTKTQEKNINVALAENLGAYASSMGEEGAEKENVAQIDYKMVTFSLAGKDYAIDIMKVKEIVKTGWFTYVPNTLPFVLGVHNLRGEIIPVVDLRLFFNIEVEERQDDKLENMLIVFVGDQVFGIVVDVIDKVVGIQKSSIQPPHPLFGDINIKYIQGVVEVDNRLFILLDIERIFGSKSEAQAIAEDDSTQKIVKGVPSKVKVKSVKNQPMPEVAPVAAQNAAPEVVDLSFVKNSLEQMRKFTVSSLNEAWLKERYTRWAEERGKDKTQLASTDDADAFLKDFYSPCSGSWWTKEYADAVYKVLPDNTAKQITVWNPGCGKGMETFSLACLLKKRYPEAKLKIYAHDIDLLNVSNAPLISIPEHVANDWYAPYVTTKTNGEYTFTTELKNCIMFEYHDCTNTNALPVCDIILARDLVSFVPEAAQVSVINDFEEKLKGNGILILGKNESLEGNGKWIPKKEGSVVSYTKA